MALAKNEFCTLLNGFNLLLTVEVGSRLMDHLLNFIELLILLKDVA